MSVRANTEDRMDVGSGIKMIPGRTLVSSSWRGDEGETFVEDSP